MNFDDTRKYIETCDKIDGHKFNKITDVTNMIDFLNKENEKKSEKYFNNEIHEISKFLVRTLTNKTFILGGRK